MPNFVKYNIAINCEGTFSFCHFDTSPLYKMNGKL